MTRSVNRERCSRHRYHRPVDDDPARWFAPTDGLSYLDSATYGLPPIPTVDALSGALSAWQAGSAYWIDDWDVAADRARASFAGLVGLPPGDVSLAPAASVGVGIVAASLTASDRVVVPDDEFTSLLFPLLVAEQRGVTMTRVPFEALTERIEPGTTLVATSLVQMQTGRVAALEALLDRAGEVGARVLVDATQGLPFVGVRGEMARVDYMVCAAYKHLLCPRGVAFFVVRAEHHDALAPWNANWRAADDPYGRYAGGSLTLAEGAARFDVSVAWLPWVGGAVSLELIREWSEAGLLARPVAMAADLAGRLGVDHGGASIVCVPVADRDATSAALDRARVKGGFRGDGVRLSTHVYTTEADLERAVTALRR